MAKLSARGRKELVRLVRAALLTEGLVVERKTTVALMSDGVILSKEDVVFADRQKHSYGWKKTGKLDFSKTTLEVFINHYEKKGYSK